MGTARTPQRLLPDGSPLHNRLLAALPSDTYAAVCRELRMMPVSAGDALLEHGIAITHVYFPNTGVYSVTNEMKHGSLPWVTKVIGALQKAGMISSHYGRITVLDRKKLERGSCECYEVIAGHYKRLGS